MKLCVLGLASHPLGGERKDEKDFTKFKELSRLQLESSSGSIGHDARNRGWFPDRFRAKKRWRVVQAKSDLDCREP